MVNLPFKAPKNLVLKECRTHNCMENKLITKGKTRDGKGIRGKRKGEREYIVHITEIAKAFHFFTRVSWVASLEKMTHFAS